jgi:putative membrane protein
MDAPAMCRIVTQPSVEYPLKQPRPTFEPIEPQVFIAAASMESMSDAQLARLALVRATTESIRAVAMHFIDDCNVILLDIARIATRKNLTLPTSLDQDHDIIAQQMGAKMGADFDSAYIDRIALNHRHAIKLFKRGQTIKIPEISAFASRALAKIEARIKLSRQLAGSIDSLLDAGAAPHHVSSADAERSRY